MSIMSEWISAHGQPQPVSGVTESPGNHPAPRRPDQLASGHPVSAEPYSTRADYQVTAPRSLAVVQTSYGESAALASSIEQHQGRVVLGLMDQSGAANASLTSQLSAPPSGQPHMSGGADRTAPSGHGQSG